MITINSGVIEGWIVNLLWPLTRILAVIAVAPLLSHNALPMRVKIGLGVLITLTIMPLLPAIPEFTIFSFQGLLLLVEQVIIGLAIGFSMRLFVSAVEIAGQLIAMSMGLGFATFFDPESQGQTTAITQFLMILTMLFMLSLDVHLVVIQTLVESFMTLPISTASPDLHLMQILDWGEAIFSLGLILALPAVATLLIINMALGILTRTAPQLNIFGVGFPVTLSMGFLILALALPGMMHPLENLIQKGMQSMRVISQNNSQ